MPWFSEKVPPIKRNAYDKPIAPPIKKRKKQSDKPFNIRDQFAIAAMQSLIDNKKINMIPDICQSAYRMADGMLKQRKKK